MIRRHETPGLQKGVILLASLIGLACCILAALDARSQQTDDSQAGRPTIHHMRGWPSGKG